MTTGWLLLLVVIVNSQSTTDDVQCDGDVLSELKTAMQVLHDNELVRFQTIMNRLMSVDSQLLQFQTIMSRLANNDNQSTTDDGVYDMLSELKGNTHTLLENHLQFQGVASRHGAVLSELQRDMQILQDNQRALMSRLGKFLPN